MGLLTEGRPLSWEETKVLANHVREHGTDQFINLYHQLVGRRGDVLKWGDEVSNVVFGVTDVYDFVARRYFLFLGRIHNCQV